MHDPFKDRNNYRRILQEAKVTITDEQGKVLLTKPIADDKVDEVVWAVDKYSWEPIKHGRRKKKGAPEGDVQSEKVLQVKSKKMVRTIAEQLVDPSRVDALVDVITPWGQAGFDTLRRIYEATNATKKSFPFFASAPAVKPGATISVPDSPSSAAVEMAAATRPFVGGKQSGAGEFLFCLMTGAVAGSKLGDVTMPGGGVWEVKAIGKGGNVRLGETSSIMFEEAIRKSFKEGALASVTSMDADELLNNIKNPHFYATLTGKQGDLIRSEIDDALSAAASRGNKLSGYVVFTGSSFHVLDTSSVEFYNRIKGGRVAVRPILPKPSGE